MGGKKHALEIFRATSKGFEEATRKPSNHRKVAGKVLASRRRDTSKKTRRSRPALGRSRGSPAGSTSRASSRPSRWSVKMPATPGRKLLWASLSIVATMSVWVMIADSGGGDLVPLQRSTLVAVTPEYTILLGTYPSESKVWEAKDAMQKRGLAEVEVVGFPVEEGSETMTKYGIILGKSVDRAALESRLVDVQSWVPDAELLVYPSPEGAK